MKRFSALLVCGCLLTGCATAPMQDWTKQDTAMTIAMNTSLAVDMVQTNSIARDAAFQETNPVMGSAPSQQQVNLYFVGCFVVANTAVLLLNPTWRHRVLRFVTQMEVSVDAHNYKLGVRP